MIFETLLEVLQNITRYDTQNHEIIDEVLTTWIHILDHLGHSKVGIAKFIEIGGIEAMKVILEKTRSLRHVQIIGQVLLHFYKIQLWRQ